MQLSHLSKLVSLYHFIYIKIVLNKLMFPEKPFILEKKSLLTWILILFCVPVKTAAFYAQNPLIARRVLNKREENQVQLQVSPCFYLVKMKLLCINEVC